MPDAPAQAVTIRRLAPGDVARVAEFERDIAVASFPEDPVTDLGFYEKKLRAAIDDRKAEPLVAVAGGELAAWAWIAARENFVTGEVYGDLRSFYVAPGFRAAGPGFRLMRHVLDIAKAKGFSRVAGRTAATNDAMQAIYGLYGFAPRHVTYEIALGPAPAPRRPFTPKPARSDRPRRRDSRAP